MKKTLLLFVLILWFSSCWTEEKSVVEESAEIVSDYTDTLEWSIIDAKNAVDSMNKNIETHNNSTKNITE